MDRRKAISILGAALFPGLGVHLAAIAVPAKCSLKLDCQMPMRFAVMGVGHGGGNVVEAMYRRNANQLPYIFVNTDRIDLQMRTGGYRLQLGQSGLGCGSQPHYGRDAVLQSEQPILAALAGVDVLLIVVAMGGGTGTGATPAIASLAKARGVHCICIAATPFRFEGPHRCQNAAQGIQDLLGVADSVIVMDNEAVVFAMGCEETTQDEFFECSNSLVASVVHGITDIANTPGHVGVEFFDMKAALSHPRVAVSAMGVGLGSGRASEAATMALRMMAMQTALLSEAVGVMVVISARQDSLKQEESKCVLDAIRRACSSSATVVYGTRYENTIGGQLRVTLIATGLSWISPIEKPGEFW